MGRIMKKALVKVFLALLFLGFSTLAAHGVEYFSPTNDTVEYRVTTLKIDAPIRMTMILTREKTGEAVSIEGRPRERDNAKGNAFYVKVPDNTFLTVTDGIQVIHTDPAFAKPEDSRKEAVSGGDRDPYLEFFMGESVFFRKHSHNPSFTIWFHTKD
jgi:hypothetical protein